MLTEATALRILRNQLSSTYKESRRGVVRLGIGDDSAVLAIPGQQVVSTDACNEGSHFLRAWVSPRDLAHKSFHSALSDLPAMGATPAAAVCHLTLPAWVSARFLTAFADEQSALARAQGVALVGGNVAFGDSLQIICTVIGRLEGNPVTQSGARPGDEIWLIGTLGLARAGYLLLSRGIRQKGPSVRAALSAFRRPVAQCKSGRRLLSTATSCIDVSDGLLADGTQLASSSGVRFVFSERALAGAQASHLTELGRIVGESALHLMVHGGEDYALLATGPEKSRPRDAVPLGFVEAGQGAVLDCQDGRRRPLRACQSWSPGVL